MADIFNGAALTLLAAIWSCGLPALAGGQRHALLPELPAPGPAPGPAPSPPPPTAPASAAVPPGSVRWGMPAQTLFRRTHCPLRHGDPWDVLGRDGDLIHTMATYTNQLDGCVQVNVHEDPYENLTNGKFHVYGESMHWAPQMLDRVGYLYPHALESICLMIRRAEFEKREIFAAFLPEVYIFIGLYLLIFILILRFGFKVDVIEAMTEATETFLTGGFGGERRPLMIWGSLFSLIVLNSFSGVFTSFLTVPKRGYEVETLEEVTEHFDHIAIPPYLRQALLSQVDTSDHPKLFALFETNKSTEELREFIYPILVPEMEFKYLGVIISKNVEVRLMKECMWSFVFVSFAVAKNWDLADRYGSLLMRMAQAGIVLKATDDEWRKYSYYIRGFDAVKQNSHRPKLSLIHFVDSFVTLGVGAGAGLVCFLAELALTSRARFNACYMFETTV